jgi:hypothetical protein
MKGDNKNEVPAVFTAEGTCAFAGILFVPFRLSLLIATFDTAGETLTGFTRTVLLPGIAVATNVGGGV